MKITKNEMLAVLTILKSPEKEYNANNLSKLLNITSMGALKILKKLEKDNILTSKKIGNASIYKLNLKNKYAIDYAEFLLKREAEKSTPYVKRWVREVRKTNNPEIAILFGSVLEKEEKAKDVDVFFVVKEKNFNKLKREVKKLNELNEKKIHPIYQTPNDLKTNINKQDKVVLKAIKGIIVSGERKFIKLIEESE